MQINSCEYKTKSNMNKTTLLRAAAMFALSAFLWQTVPRHSVRQRHRLSQIIHSPLAWERLPIG